MCLLWRARSLAFFRFSPGKQSPYGSGGGNRAVLRVSLGASLAERPVNSVAKLNRSRHHHDEYQQTNQKREGGTHANGSQHCRRFNQFCIYETSSR